MLCGLFINLAKNHKMTCIRLFFPFLELASTCSCCKMLICIVWAFLQMYCELNLLWFLRSENSTGGVPGLIIRSLRQTHFFSHYMTDRILSPSCSWALVASQAAIYCLRMWNTKTGTYFQQWCWAKGHIVLVAMKHPELHTVCKLSRCGSSTLPMAGRSPATLIPRDPKLLTWGEKDERKPTLLGYPRASWAPRWGSSAGKQWDIWEPSASPPPKDFWRVLSAF